jgi:cobalt-precorrin 5A hydrolase
MGFDEMKIAIGVGCRKGCASDAIVALVRRALARAGCENAAAGLFTHPAKREEAGLIEAASRLKLPLVFLDPEALRDAADRVATRSETVMALFDLPSIAETAALAGAGAGSRLLAPRISAAGASCAIAKGRNA